jgi:hypothetical protein
MFGAKDIEVKLSIQPNPIPPEHGTRARYVSRYYNCKCELCKDANARYMIRYRSDRKQRKKQTVITEKTTKTYGTGYIVNK